MSSDTNNHQHNQPSPPQEPNDEISSSTHDTIQDVPLTSNETTHEDKVPADPSSGVEPSPSDPDDILPPGGNSDQEAGRSEPSSDDGSRHGLVPEQQDGGSGTGHDVGLGDKVKANLQSGKKTAVTFCKFVGPGFMVAVAYIDPGNYATDVAAGSSYQFKLLSVVFLSNVFAIFLQALSIKLGTVSGLNLAEACRAFLPWWLNLVLYLLAETAIIATDVAEVIGTAIAINLLTGIPLVWGCALSILEVLGILLLYKPKGSMPGLRAFEVLVMLLVLTVVVCFCIQLHLIKDTTSAGEVFRGFLPSRVLFERTALYQACGILGATVMPHSLYLGSGIVQARLYEFDSNAGLLPPSLAANPPPPDTADDGPHRRAYMPSLQAIRHALAYSVAELILCLFTVALFINSAILIVAGASLYRSPDATTADLFGIHDLLSRSIGPAAGTVFAVALLFSGMSAGIVCTIAGQMVSEGALRWTVRPWVRRLVTRSVSIVPSIVIAALVGREGLDAALNGSQVALSVTLPFVTAPLVYFTSVERYMRVKEGGGARYGVHGGSWGRMGADGEDGEGEGEGDVSMKNGPVVVACAVGIWLVMAAMNVANLVMLGGA
ncbi:natural resistance-associated macrophage protein-domain-containing protein [Podospora conica]|nr:natural resistance-associated macrophage protein-domain-containing protein [Schizothecium conicum]